MTWNPAILVLKLDIITSLVKMTTLGSHNNLHPVPVGSAHRREVVLRHIKPLLAHRGLQLVHVVVASPVHATTWIQLKWAVCAAASWEESDLRLAIQTLLLKIQRHEWLCDRPFV